MVPTEAKLTDAPALACVALVGDATPLVAELVLKVTVKTDVVLKVAVTALSDVIETVQVPDPEQLPPQLANS
jgi:hypothetical protein